MHVVISRSKDFFGCFFWADRCAMCWSTFIVDMIDVNKTLYCISVVKISYSVLMVTIVSCITPRFLDSSHFPRSRGLWQCWNRFFCYTVSWSYYSVKCRLRISWLSDEDCAVSQNPNREGRLHFMTTKGVRSWSNASLSRIKDRPCLKINHKFYF